ncbi:AraC family transcriptional regulator [Bradyrhizobium japonicum]|uniref:AraC family transcriptional regulator n=1 Tax=Bradyrhizobium japonicum TaxID=375 RepID=UPI001BA7D615|nr:AraC family transcriptional regulator [Bradyrhizobium japonicum]MBR0911566.1 AraC family transcriptional regulator [Bradyrhizobium japonicum]
MLDPSVIYKHPIFRSNERSETHWLVSEELADHRLRWHGDAIDTQLYKFNTPRLSLYSLRYGAAVSISPDLYQDFSLVHFSLRGSISIEADGAGWNLPEGRAIISSPSSKINLHWSNACEQIILRVPDTMLMEAAVELKQPHLYCKIKDNPGLMLSDIANRQWQAQLQAFMALEENAGTNTGFSRWLRHMESCLAMFLLLQAGSVERQAHGEPETPSRVRQAKQRLDRLHSYLDSHLTSPVNLSDLAAAAALSERQLNTLCHDHLGMSPMMWLRTLRMEAVRKTLRDRPESDIAATAMLYGFFNLGRFAAYYRKHFGELPSQTVRIAKSG